MTKQKNEGPTEAEFEEMFRGMLKRDVARLNDALADNPNPGDGEAYRTGHCPRLVLHVRTMAGDVSAIRGGCSFEARLSSPDQRGDCITKVLSIQLFVAQRIQKSRR